MDGDSTMLTLTRREGESLIIELNEAVNPATPVGDLLGDGMMLHIHKTRDGQVQLSLDAHPGLTITRSELLEADDQNT
jgi:sRNA-binding carbon storage regulator CsrA